MAPTRTLPSVIDQRARAEGTTIATLRDLIPPECHVIDPVRSWTALAVAVLRLALALLVLTRIEPVWAWSPALVWQIPALLAAWLFAGWCYTGIFVIGHDCGHLAFSERRWVNEVVGHVCLAPVFTGYHNWRIWHNFHHAKTQLRGLDPDWAEKMMTRAEYETAPLGDKAHVRLGFGTPLGILVGFWKGMFRRTFMNTTASQIEPARRAKAQLFVSSTLMVAASVSVGFWLFHTGGVWMLLKLYLVPTFIAAAHGALLTYLHHTSADAMVFDRRDWTPFRGQVASTFNVRFPRWIEALWFDINIHLVHHLAPRIPWYHLRAATEAIRAKNPEWIQERRFSFSYLRASWARPLLVRVSGVGGPGGGDHYEMSPFEAVPEPAVGVQAERPATGPVH
jgi:acyl-lipid omega-6 desaturase (Delta-12 desaturase)